MSKSKSIIEKTKSLSSIIDKTKGLSSTVIELPHMDDHFADVKQRNNIDVMLRTTQNHHIQLSVMADHKANILIGATLIIQTFIISMANTGTIALEFIILSFFSFCSTWLAVQSVFPSLKKIHTKKEDRNLLFFGHFTEMEINDYYKDMSALLKSDKLVYKAMVKDIYHLCLYLQNRKYKYLRFSYITFLAGLLLAFLVFLFKSFGDVFS